ncbi:carbonic anhydrase [Bacillus sp. J33]|uniref:carbonic anhydrase n=1 Tax=Bacillus sp. J33 TaxID=935836 RepID=UPI0004AF0BAE|nr:carbonic anhydrase family protein [Bacillus sp. J33]
MRNTICTRLFAAAVLLFMTACTPAPQHAPEEKNESDNSGPSWSYSGNAGPDNWDSLDPSFSACANGTEQSPIDIELANVQLDKSLAEININYTPTSFTLVNNGHTIQANDASGRNTLTVDNEEYILLQMHFHKPSEHLINGQPFEMEGHLVHQNTEGKLAVLGFLINAGNENKIFAEMFSKLPQVETEEDVTLEKFVDLENLLPNEKNFFRYSGSLTTPPCSEDVKWIVMDQPIEMSKEQIEAFGSIFPHNSRPIQPLNGRKVSEQES